MFAKVGDTHIRRWTARLSQVFAFARCGISIGDKIKMAVVGYARGHTFDSAGLMSRLGRNIFPSIQVRPEQLGGLLLQLDPSDISHLVAVDEILFQRVYSIDRVPFVPDVIIDCGANIGVFTLLAAANFPDARVIAFEPDSKNLQWLRRQVSANHLHVEVIEAAVSDSDGEAQFMSDLGIGSALASSGVTDGRAVNVKTVRLASFLKATSAERLLLKLDVEGAEEAVVPDIVDVLPSDCAIFFETHGGEESWNNTSQRMRSAGLPTTFVRNHDRYFEGYAVRVRS